MGFRFRKTLKIAPGVRLNVGKKGASVSLGGKGVRHTVGRKGRRTSVGIPGTGVSYGTKTQGCLVPVVVIGALLALVAACSSTAAVPTPTPVIIYVTPPPAPTSPPTPSPSPTFAARDIAVSFVLTAHPGVSPTVTGGCVGTGGYSDIREGMQVQVRGPEGRLLGAATFNSSTLGGAGTMVTCTLRTTVEDVPEVSSYVLEVGRRGEVVYSLAQMQQQGWSVTLTLGS